MIANGLLIQGVADIPPAYDVHLPRLLDALDPDYIEQLLNELPITREFEIFLPMRFEFVLRFLHGAPIIMGFSCFGTLRSPGKSSYRVNSQQRYEKRHGYLAKPWCARRLGTRGIPQFQGPSR